MAQLADYFTIQEFRSLVGDSESPYRYTDTDITRAQAEVIQTLERWAGTAWVEVSPVGYVHFDVGLGLSKAVLTHGQDPDFDWATEVTDGYGDPGTLNSGAGLRIRILSQGDVDGHSDLTTYVTSYDAGNDALNLAAPAAVTGTGPWLYYVEGSAYPQATAYPALGDFHPLRAKNLTPRSTTDYFDHVDWYQVYLTNVPAIKLTGNITDNLGNVLVDIWSDTYTLDYDTGILTFGDISPDNRLLAPVERIGVPYQFGYVDETPWSVKRPCIKSAKTLLDSDQQRGKVPRNVRTYETEKTTFDFGKKTGPMAPWPWDPVSSEDISSYWEANRPTEFSVL